MLILPRAEYFLFELIVMPRPFLTWLFMISLLSGWAQPRTHSIGVFMGITSSFTYDEGIIQDQRYQNRYSIKFAPIGISYGIDFEDIGFLVTPGIISIGQNFDVVNTTSGNVGVRTINLQYLNVPIACKLRLIDLSFFRVSLLGSVSAAYLLKGKETITHEDAKLKFPDEIVPPILPPTYTRVYDGVLSPAVSKYTMLTKTNFNPIQFFVGIGLRSDWDVSESWRVSFDLRANYGLLEPRNNAYLDQAKTFQTLYDIAGTRRDMFVQLNIGVSKYITLEKKDRKKNGKVTPRKYTPKRHAWNKRG